MSSLHINRIACKFLALAGVAFALSILPSCGEDAERKRVAYLGHLPPGTGAMPEDWPLLVQGILPELRRNVIYAQSLAAVEDTPEATWQYWKTLLGELEQAGLLPHIASSGDVFDINLVPQGQNIPHLRNQALIYRAFRKELEEAIIRHTQLTAEDAKHARMDEFPAIWQAYMNPTP